MSDNIDLYVGSRLRHRRKLTGLTQQQLADRIGVRFQQIQKYESGTNRVSASRLYKISEALATPIQYFFDGYKKESEQTHESKIKDIMEKEETVDLVRAYYGLHELPRRYLLRLAKSLSLQNS